MSDTKKNIIVIGNGMVGHRFCEKLVEFDALNQFNVTVLGEEPRRAYDRVHLTSYFEDDKTDEDLFLCGKDWYSAYVIVVSLRLGWQFLVWLGRIYVMTDRRMIVSTRLPRPQIIEAPLPNIDDATLTDSRIQRLFALGTIMFTIRDRNPDNQTDDTQWQMVARPVEVHEAVITALNQYSHHR